MNRQPDRFYLACLTSCGLGRDMANWLSSVVVRGCNIIDAVCTCMCT